MTTPASSARTSGRAVGILYIVGTVAGILSVAAIDPVRQASTTLGGVDAHPAAIPLAASAVLVMGLALAMIPIVAYPVLRVHSATLARGYVVFRSGLEAVGYVAMVLGWLLLIPMAHDVADGADGTTLRPVADALFAGEGAATVGTVVFLIGATMFYVVLWRARLVPRWISGWGLVAIVPYFVPVVLSLANVADSASGTAAAFDVPLAIQEMVLAVWLIVKGFRVDAAPRVEPGPAH